jgi:nucleoside-diphosphate-sugar epimerase
MKLHTILGAGGSISTQLLPILQENNERVRIVSRKAHSTTVESVVADVTSYHQTLRAVKDSDVVYLLAGLPYDIRVWKQAWPQIMTNVINACKEHGSKLVFFDNVYMYGKVDGVMTEETPFNPVSKKGEVRAGIATQLLNEIESGNIKALIARSADFYGPPGLTNSAVNLLVFGNLAKHKKVRWLINPRTLHSFTYVPDAARALYSLATNENAFGQTWHMPTANRPLTGEEIISEAARQMDGTGSYAIISKGMMRLAGLFNRTIKELVEMSYQNEFQYIFDSSKFNKAFNFAPTPYPEGIRQTARWALDQQR